MSSAELAPPERSTDGLTTRRVTFTPAYAIHTITATASISDVQGAYFSVGDEVEMNAGEPIQPRTSVSITLAGETSAWRFFEGGTYKVLPDFDPVITRIISDVVALSNQVEEPVFKFPKRWQPPTWR